MSESYLYVVVDPEYESPEEATFRVSVTKKPPTESGYEDDGLPEEVLGSHHFTWNNEEVNRQLAGRFRGATKPPRPSLGPVVGGFVQQMAEGLMRMLAPEHLTRERRRIGEFLYEQIFREEAGQELEKAIADARAASGEVKLRLVLNSPSLSVLPWECMYYPPPEDEYVALIPEVSMARLQPSHASWRRHAITLPLRVLLVDSWIGFGASIREYDLEAARNQLVQYEDKLAVHLIRHPTLDDLVEQVVGGEFHVVHFFAHVESGTSGPQLVLPDEQGEGWYRSYFMEDLSSLFIGGVRLLVLTPYADWGRTWLGNLIGARVEDIGVPGVVTTQIELSVSGIADFAQSFYPALAEGKPVDRAVADAQRRLAADRRGPVGALALFLSTPDSRLFDLVDEKTPTAMGLEGIPSRESVIDVFQQVASVAGDDVVRAEIEELLESEELDAYLEGEAEDEVSDDGSVQEL